VFEDSVEVDAPVESVFDFVADPRNDGRWCPRVVWCEQRQGNGPGRGACYEAFHRPTLQRPHRRWIDVVAFERPTHMRSTQVDDVAVFDITYHLTPTVHGTRLTQRDEIDWKIARAFLPIAKHVVRRHIGDQLATLKELVESGATQSRRAPAVEAGR
jgi:hypothetical protein